MGSEMAIRDKRNSHRPCPVRSKMLEHTNSCVRRGHNPDGDDASRAGLSCEWVENLQLVELPPVLQVFAVQRLALPLLRCGHNQGVVPGEAAASS